MKGDVTVQDMCDTEKTRADTHVSRSLPSTTHASYQGPPHRLLPVPTRNQAFGFPTTINPALPLCPAREKGVGAAQTQALPLESDQSETQ